MLPDNISKIIKDTPANSQAKVLLDIAWSLRFSEAETAIKLSNLAVEISQTKYDQITLTKAYNYLGVFYTHWGHYPEALEYIVKAKKIAEETNNYEQLGYSYINIAIIDRYNGDYIDALKSLRKAQVLMEKIKLHRGKNYVHSRLSEVYLDLKQIDSALFHAKKIIELGEEVNEREAVIRGNIALANVYSAMGNYRNALNIYQGYTYDPDRKNQLGVAIAEAHYGLHNLDSALYYAQSVYDNSFATKSYRHLCEASSVIAKVYEDKRKFDSALHYSKLETIYKDSLSSDEKLHKIRVLKYVHEGEIKDKEIEFSTERVTKFYLLLLALVMIVIILALLLFVQRKHKIEQKKATEILQQQHDKIEVQADELKEMVQTKDKFFSIIAHDLRNPLGSFRELSKMMTDNYDLFDDLERHENLTIMKNSADNLFELLENLLEWSRAQRGLIQFNPQEFNLFFVAHNCEELLRLTAEKKNIQVINKIPFNYPMFADANLINTIIRNLLSNSIKFTPNGGTITIGVLEDKPEDKNIRDNCVHPEIATDSTKECIQCYDCIDEHCIYICDSGIGMDEETKSKLFRIDKSITTKGTSGEPGTGLGLILCKEFTELHDGRIWVESEIGKGTTFYFTIKKSSPAVSSINDEI